MGNLKEKRYKINAMACRGKGDLINEILELRSDLLAGEIAIKGKMNMVNDGITVYLTCDYSEKGFNEKFGVKKINYLLGFKRK